MILLALIGFTMMGVGGNIANNTQQEFVKHAHTWKGEMLCPPGNDNCNDVQLMPEPTRATPRGPKQ